MYIFKKILINYYYMIFQGDYDLIFAYVFILFSYILGILNIGFRIEIDQYRYRYFMCQLLDVYQLSLSVDCPDPMD